MKVYIQFKDGGKAYYRKQGIYCFDFVTLPEDATELTEEECRHILTGDDFYKKMYGAETMGIEE